MKPGISAAKMAVIVAITHAREQSALARISKAVERRDEAAKAVNQLLAVDPEPKSAAEAKLTSKWLIWKQKELGKRNVELAAAEAEYQKTVRQSGREIAEHAVMTGLLAQARSKARRDRETQASITFLDEQSP